MLNSWGEIRRSNDEGSSKREFRRHRYFKKNGDSSFGFRIYFGSPVSQPPLFPAATSVIRHSGFWFLISC